MAVNESINVQACVELAGNDAPAWRERLVATALVPEYERFHAYDVTTLPSDVLGLMLAGSTGSGKTSTLAELIRPLNAQYEASGWPIEVVYAGQIYRSFGRAMMRQYENAESPLAPQDWLAQERILGYPEPIISNSRHDPTFDAPEVGLWASLVVDHPKIFSDVETCILARLCGLVGYEKTFDGPGIAIVDGLRSFELGEVRFNEARIAPVGRVLFVTDEITAASDSDEPLGQSFSRVQLRNRLDRNSRYPMTTLDDIPQAQRIMLHDLLIPHVKEKLTHAILQQGLTAQESADGWARALVGAGLRAAADPGVTLVARREELESLCAPSDDSEAKNIKAQALIAMALRTFIHGLIGATCYDWRPASGFDVPEAIL